jgi:hypothetical protein
MIRLSLSKRVLSLQASSLYSLRYNSENNKRLVMIERELKLKTLALTLQRTLMALRYEGLMQKNQRLMQLNLKNSLAIRSFSGWKYQIVLAKTRRYFETIRVQKDVAFFFHYWHDL